MANLKFLAILLLTFSASLAAQDAYTITGQEQTIIYQSDWVRVRRVMHQPGETAPMHDHKQRVSVYLTDATVRLTAPDGKSQELHYTPGLVKWTEPTRHSLLNVGKTPVDVIEVEFLGPRPPRQAHGDLEHRLAGRVGLLRDPRARLVADQRIQRRH